VLDFALLRERKVSIVELSAGLGADDLRQLTNEMVDTMCDMIEGCTDDDVVFVPDDPEAHDAAAATEEEVGMAWTLGHVIVHTTASSEEAAALATKLARGVTHRGGRSRSEVHWKTITTIAQCRHRLEESRRMRLASLDMWPDKPYLDNTFQLAKGGPPAVTQDRPNVNAAGRFILGLLHDDSHLGQIEEIVRQAKAARGGGSG
jgi:hypothetical protein